jgi:branched-chain amino acid transport system ATP-binding protein
VLSVESVVAGYGDAIALDGVSLQIGTGELVAVVGANGAGKTTLVSVIARLLPLRAGRLVWDGIDLGRLAPQALGDQGIALIPEGRRLFGAMSVEENLDMGAYRSSARGERSAGLERVYAMFPILRERRHQLAGTLSGGQQQMVAIGRALMARPRLLLIDEPSLGLAPSIVSQVFEVIRSVHDEGLSILLIEQNVALALATADRAYVMADGRMVADGPAAELMRRDDVREAYLGAA